jgi:hypothetical protein
MSKQAHQNETISIRLQQELQECRDANSSLIIENKMLKKKLILLEKHPIIVKGIKGEKIILNLLNNAQPSKPQASHDIELLTDDLTLEIKFAKLNLAGKNTTTQRWSWMKVLGESGKKEYHRLILIGDTDPKFKNKYKDPESPYIVFDVPYDKVDHLSIHSGKGKKNIQLTTNPDTAKRSKAAILFSRYQITFTELSEKYAI